MKKMLYILFAVAFLAACAGCIQTIESSTTQTNPAQTDSAQPSPSPTCEELTTVVWMADWAPFESLTDIVEVSKTIIVGKVTAVLPAVRIDKIAYGYSTSTDPEAQDWSNVTRNEVEVLQSLKGELQIGEQINVDQNGGLAECINEYGENMPFLKEGSIYILFLSELPTAKGTPYFEYKVGAFDSLAEVIEGKVQQHEYSEIFEENMPLENAVEVINSAIDSVKLMDEEEASRKAALTDLTAAQGAQTVSEYFANDPHQSPVRDLTDEEMQAVYDFENDIRILAVSGKLLENGDRLIWIKTQELTRQQCEELESALIPAAAQAAAALDWGHQVKVTPFHSMIVIARGEDRATILEKFRRALVEIQE
ncbi:MAG: membrane lipoprotein lipid attachment site-containing protein [Clostridia bacterium]|jgi:hypothetical protein|nr:membrane lipoprotein lipid attachment site-containing protein [Clostridia bacterium]MBT7122958.1 membrane lipoprotein lipid attachment site-containing protein [Clostridia bacterium]